MIMAVQNTSDRILDVTQELIQSRGYSAMSFNDIALEVGIKKPSIMHHFPSKVALAVAVVDRYRKNFAEMYDGMLSNKNNNPSELIDTFFSPYLNLGENGEKICLCGALAGEYMALPEAVRDEVTSFFAESKKCLAAILAMGKEKGTFDFDGEPEVVAGLILDTLQGALIVSRATSDTENVKNTIDALRAEILS